MCNLLFSQCVVIYGCVKKWNHTNQSFTNMKCFMITWFILAWYHHAFKSYAIKSTVSIKLIKNSTGISLDYLRMLL